MSTAMAFIRADPERSGRSLVHGEGIIVYIASRTRHSCQPFSSSPPRRTASLLQLHMERRQNTGPRQTHCPKLLKSNLNHAKKPTNAPPSVQTMCLPVLPRSMRLCSECRQHAASAQLGRRWACRATLLSRQEQKGRCVGRTSLYFGYTRFVRVVLRQIQMVFVRVCHVNCVVCLSF